MESGVRVLVAEDEVLVAEMVKGLLKDMSHNLVGVATDGHQAIAMTRTLRPDVVLMDIEMPGIDGIEAARQINECCPTPIIILTAYDNPELVESARNAGVGAYIIKLPSARELDRTMSIAIARFNDLMEQRRLSAELQEAKQEIEHTLADLQDTQQTLRASQARLQYLLDVSPAVIYSCKTTTQGRGLEFTYISHNVQRMLGYSSQEFYDDADLWLEILHPDDAPCFLDVEESLFRDGQVVMEYRLRHKDGHFRWLHDELRLAHNGQGSTSEVIGAWFDITHRKCLENGLLQAQKMEAVGQLAAGLAHDFNNLLTSIIGFAELMQFQMVPADPMQRMTGQIVDSGQKAARLVSQLLAFSRKQMVRPKILDLNEVLHGMQDRLACMVGANVELYINYATGLWPAQVDPDQVEEVVTFLASYARDSMSGNGRLSIETANASIEDVDEATESEVTPGDYVQIRVSHNGPALAQDEMARIFEPFYFSSTSVADGVGMRLAAVYGIVRQNEGFIQVRSFPDQDTSIVVYLPRYVEKENSSSTQAQA